MKYKTKLVLLILFIAVCIFLFITSFIFNPQNRNTRKAFYTWIDKTWTQQADKIVVKGTDFISEPIILIRKNDFWYLLANQIEYPVKQQLVEDLLTLLSTRAVYPVHSTSVSSHNKLGVTEQLASRIIVYGGASQIPLLDLLIGSGNSTGNEIYLRKNGTPEVRSGADEFTYFSDAEQNFWFDLRLFYEEEKLTSEKIQQIRIFKNNEKEFSYTLSRYAYNNETLWNLNSSSEMIIDNIKTEFYINDLLTTKAADFAENVLPSDYDFSFGKINLLLDDLSEIDIIIAPEIENDQHPTMISNNPFVYLIPAWNIKKILPETESFIYSP